MRYRVSQAIEASMPSWAQEWEMDLSLQRGRGGTSLVARRLCQRSRALRKMFFSICTLKTQPNLIQIVINHTQNSTIESFIPWYFYFPLLSYLCSMVYQNYILNTLSFMVHLCVFYTFNFNLRQHLNSSSTVYGPLKNMILQNKAVSLNRLHWISFLNNLSGYLLTDCTDI